MCYVNLALRGNCTNQPDTPLIPTCGSTDTNLQFHCYLPDTPLIPTCGSTSSSEHLLARAQICCNGDHGVLKRVVRAGHGVRPGPGSLLKVHYSGRLALRRAEDDAPYMSLAGAAFDSSTEQEEPFEFVLGRRQERLGRGERRWMEGVVDGSIGGVVRDGGSVSPGVSKKEGGRMGLWRGWGKMGQGGGVHRAPPL